MNTPNKHDKCYVGQGCAICQDCVNKMLKDYKAQALAEKGLVKLDDVMKIIDELHKDFHGTSVDNCSAIRCGYRELKAKLQEIK